VKQGESLSPDLREISGLKKEVVLVGGLKLFEIWDRERWEEEFEKAKASFPTVTQTLQGLGI
jgi:MraZ protein